MHDEQRALAGLLRWRSLKEAVRRLASVRSALIPAASRLHCATRRLTCRLARQSGLLRMEALSRAMASSSSERGGRSMRNLSSSPQNGLGKGVRSGSRVGVEGAEASRVTAGMLMRGDNESCSCESG